MCPQHLLADTSSGRTFYQVSIKISAETRLAVHYRVSYFMVDTEAVSVLVAATWEDMNFRTALILEPAHLLISCKLLPVGKLDKHILDTLFLQCRSQPIPIYQPLFSCHHGLKMETYLLVIQHNY